MKVINPFTLESEARRYHKYRPKYHHIPIAEIHKLTGTRFSKSLDVACGTGDSTQAIGEYSDKVVGVDLSQAMLAEAKLNSDIEFINAKAEELPFEDSQFDYVNISMGFHWLEQMNFLIEAKRVLRSEGYLSIDSYGFLRDISGATEEEQEFHDSIFKNNLKQASRNAAYPTEQMWSEAGFKLISDFKYKQIINMSADEFSNLLMTWSNFQILSDDEKVYAEKKIHQVYKTIFKGERKELNFGGRTLLLQKA